MTKTWKEFDSIMLELEMLNKQNKLTNGVVQALKRARCWKNDEPYCSWDFFTYKMSEQQLSDIVTNFKFMKKG